MATKLVLVGLATDGPANVAILPRDLNHLNKIFGGRIQERFSVNPTAISVDLRYSPWTGPANVVNSVRDGLYQPSVSGNVLSFGSIGGSANSTLDVEYSPYLGMQDVVIAARHYYEQTGFMPFVARVGGTYASLEVSGWTFQATMPGAKYNSLSLSCNGSSIVVSGMEPYLDPVTIVGPAEAMRSRMDRVRDLGACPIYITTTSSALPTFSATLSGGTDGTFTDADLETFIDTCDFPLDSTHVLLLAPITSGMISTLGSYFSYYSRCPKLFIAPATGLTTSASVTGWVQQMKTELPYRLDMLSLVVGETTNIIGTRSALRYAAESALIAFDAVGGYNLTNLGVNAITSSPLLSESELIALKSAGFNAVTRYIEKDLAIYQGVTSANDWSFLFSSKVAELHSICYRTCNKYLGTFLAEGRQPLIESELLVAMGGVNYLIPDNANVVVSKNVMYVEVTGFLPDEILKINFSIKNKPSI